MNINPETLKLLMYSMMNLINGNRKNLKNNALDICMFIFSQIGSENYVSLMNYSLSPPDVQIMSSAM